MTSTPMHHTPTARLNSPSICHAGFRSCLHATLAILSLGYLAASLVLVTGRWIDRFDSVFHQLPWSNQLEQACTAFVATWADGSYDTTMGYRHFGSAALVFAIAFALAGVGLFRRAIWGYELAFALAAIGLLEPLIRLVAIRSLTPESDSLGYQLDLQQARLAIIVASLPCAVALWVILSRTTRTSFGMTPNRWGQFTISSVATATAVGSLLLSHWISLSRVYG